MGWEETEKVQSWTGHLQCTSQFMYWPNFQRFRSYCKMFITRIWPQFYVLLWPDLERV